MRNQLVGLFERAFVEQELDALPRRHFAFFVLPLAAGRASALFGKVIAFFQFCDFFFEIHGGRIITGERAGRCALDHTVRIRHAFRRAAGVSLLECAFRRAGLRQDSVNRHG